MADGYDSAHGLSLAFLQVLETKINYKGSGATVLGKLPPAQYYALGGLLREAEQGTPCPLVAGRIGSKQQTVMNFGRSRSISVCGRNATSPDLADTKPDG